MLLTKLEKTNSHFVSQHNFFILKVCSAIACIIGSVFVNENDYGWDSDLKGKWPGPANIISVVGIVLR